MAITPAKSFRFSLELLQRVDGYATRLSEETGIPVSRNAAMAKLLTEALDALKVDRKPRSTSRAPRR